MNVSQINTALAEGNLDVPGLFPHVEDLKRSPFEFCVDFGMRELPAEPGTILLRGARQYGKSTWIEQQLRRTIETYGPGSALYLNGDEIISREHLRDQLRDTAAALNPQQPVMRIFVDEITAVPDWQRAVKRATDAGELRGVLLVTTGSKAADLRHGAERLPGRKGKLDRTSWYFTPISYSEFRRVCGDTLGPGTLPAYLVSGGCPFAAAQIADAGRLSEATVEMVRDWVYGECSQSGRQRATMLAVIEQVHKFGGTPTGQAKIARESGISNNTVAAGYIDLLQSLMCLSAAFPWDHSRKTVLRRKAAKYHFVNLLAAASFSPSHLRSIEDFEHLPPPLKGTWYEWAVAQELWRRSVIDNAEFPEETAFWQSKDHEIDFVAKTGAFVEAKHGKASALDFAWFASTLPGEQLTVVCSTPFVSRNVKGITLESFLLGEDTRG